jgi:hypothetical protein
MHDVATCIPNVLQVSRPARIVSGRYLAHNKLNAHARAELAVDIITDRADVDDLTVRQVAQLCRASLSLVKKLRKPASNEHHSASAALLKTWFRASPEERQEFIRNVGAEPLFDEISTTL